MSDSWSVVTLTKNTHAEFTRFVDWYRKLGATEIVLFFHDPDDPNIASVQDATDVRVVRLTDELLSEMGTDRSNHAWLQDNIGTYAYRSLKTDWVVRLDIDELLYVPDSTTLGQVLSTLPLDVQSPVVSPLEVLPGLSPAGKHRLRGEMEPPVLAEIYEDAAQYLRSRKGLLGHRMGKSITRTGLTDLTINAHTARYIDRARPIKRPRIATTHGIFLLHFNAEDFWSWQNKVLFRSRNASFDPALTARLRELDAMGAEGVEEMERLFAAINDFSDERFTRLVALGAGRELELVFRHCE